MIFLYIAAGLIALIILLLNMHVKLHLVIENDDTTLKAGFGPISLRLLPKKEKKPNLKKLKKSISKSQSTKKKTVKKKESGARKSQSIKGIVGQLRECSTGDVLKLVFDLLKTAVTRLHKKVKVNIKSLNVGIDRGNAADSAVACGVAWQSIAYTTSFLKNNAVLRANEESISVYPVFNEGRNAYDVDISVKIKPISVIGAVVPAVLKGFGELTKLKNKNISVTKGITK